MGEHTIDGMQGDESTGMIRVLFVLQPRALVLDWAGPAEVLRATNDLLRQQGKPAVFDLEFIGPESNPATSVGVSLAGLGPLPVQVGETAGDNVWVVLVGQPGHRVDPDEKALAPLLAWLRTLRPQTGRLEIVTVCAGAILAGYAGQLDGRQATTHHQHLEELQRIAPECLVQVNRVFVSDGPVCTSAGVTTGVDMMLHRVSRICGAAVAASVARSMVVALRRGANDPELSPFLVHREHLHAGIHRVQDAISERPGDPWTVADMARVACVSPRHLTRLFIDYASVPPLQYLRGIRLAIARSALQAGLNVGQASELAGFSSDAQLRRTWQSFGLAGTPSSPSC